MKAATHIGLLVGVAVLFLAPAEAVTPGGSGEDRAKAIFREYVALEHAFDPRVADLYSDAALIENKRTYPNGEVKVLRIPPEKYKALIRGSMTLAKEKGDRSTYSDVKYAKEGDRVRITAVRYSELKKYSSPISLLVGPDADGKWLIFEELSESRP